MPNTTQELILRISGDSKGGQDAIRQIAEALGGLGTHLEGTQSQASSLGSQIKEAFEHPLDAVKNLTGSVGGQLLDSLGSAGVVAGVTAGAIAGLTLAAVEAAKAAYELSLRAAEAGERIRDISLKTGIAVPEVSKLSYALTVAGASIDQVSNAMFMFERRMSDSPDTVDKGLRKIGLAFADIHGLAPERQFELIAAAVAATENPVDRAGALFGIFGRQGRELAPIMEKLNDALALTQGIQPFSDEEARQAEQFAMEVRALRLEIEQISVSLGRDLLPVAQFFLDWFKDIRGELASEAWIAIGGIVEQVHELALWISVIRGDAANPLLAGETDPTVRAAAAKKLQEAKDRAFDAAHSPEKLRAALFAPGSISPLTEGLEHEKSITADLTGKLELLNRARHEAALAAEKQWRATEKNLQFSREERNLAERTINSQFGGQTVLRDLMMAQGAEGGAPPIAARLLATLGGPAMRNKFGETISGVIGAMPDLGAAAQKRMADLLAGGPTLKEQLGSNFSDVFQQVPQLVVSSLTGGGGIKGALQGTGSLLGSSLGSTIGKSISMLGKFGGPIGAAIGSLAGPLMGALFNIGKPSQQELEGRDVEGQFQKQFGSFNDMLGAVAKAYDATGRSAQQARDDVNALMAAEKLGGDAAKAAIDKINQAFNEQKQDAADLDAAIKKYGFSIDELGPAMQKQKLDEQAHSLENDFRLLVGAGVDLKTVIEHMGTALNNYLQLAIKTGQEVPLEMKPIVEEMIKEGKLLDANGNAITDLGASGIKFSESFSQGIDRIVNKLNELLKGLGLIPAEAQKAADQMPRDWHLPTARGPGSDDVRATGMAGGGYGRVTKPTLFLAGEAGAEDYAFSGAGKSFAGSGAVHVHVAGPNFFRDRRGMQELARTVSDALADSVRQQVPVGVRA